jgi:Ni,Fe-hydrogenase III small subunit/NAD-dependent dihydropyrimidine dehydrogenase PreA subunit
MVFKSIAVRRAQGYQSIPDPRAACPVGFRGKPVIAAMPCEAGCQACMSACPTDAIEPDPMRIDLGRCILCGDCAPVCPTAKLSFSNDFRLAGTERQNLIVSNARPEPDPVRVSDALHKRFGRSLKLRSVSAGGCNGCELEINALTNVNFDIGRYGIDIVASPRHADGLVLSGPISRNMVQALQLCWDAMPAPKLVIAVGACAISGGPYAGSPAVERAFLDRVVPTLYVPGCPPHPLTFVCGVLDLLGIAS